MRVAIVGCGQFSRAHIQALHKIEGIEIVAVCDQDQWRAKETAGLIKNINAYNDLAMLLDREHPEVVHILTPPNTHASLAIQAMRAGCHVLVEKPMALSVEEADSMIAAARENGVKLATDHNYLFNPCILRTRQLIERGEIGKVVYVDSYYGLSEAGGSYSDVSGRSHWAWRLPGSAFTNFLPHLIYLQLAFLSDPVAVAGVTLVQGSQMDNFPTELTVLLQGSEASGVMVISMRARPYTKFVNVYGTEGMIHADLATEVCTLHKSHQVPSMLTKVIYNLEESVQLAVGTTKNTAKVALGILRRDPGLLNHLREFYTLLQADKDPIVSGEDGKKMIEIMEEIWRKTDSKLIHPPIVSAQWPVPNPKTEAERVFKERSSSGKVLVTGATGFLGYHLIEALARSGAKVVALVRNKDRVSFDLEQKAEIVCGDLRDSESVEAAMRGVKLVFHCAAVTHNNIPWEKHSDVNISGTEAVLKGALKSGVERVIHISSVIVYGLTRPPQDNVVDENTPYAHNKDKWAYYLLSKIEAERLALTYWREAGLPVTILRLGSLYGPGGRRSLGGGLLPLGPIRLMIGNCRNHLPFTYVENAVSCLLLAAVSPHAIGQAYNVVDEPQVNARELFKKMTEITGERLVLVPLPPILFSSAARLLEWREKRRGSQKPPKLSNFVVRSACRDLIYNTTKAKKQLGWQQEIAFQDGLKRTIIGYR
jgi:predicted dehydrogenase/nucleoside-diphosphate-sugar epimerase